MARISKDEHPRILQMVDGENRRVADVAAEYGCTPANIYALLSKLRRHAGPSTEVEDPDVGLPGKADLPASEDPAVSSENAAVAPPDVLDLFAPAREMQQPKASAAVARKRRGSTPTKIDRVVAVGAPVERPTPQSAAVSRPHPEPIAAIPIQAANVTGLPRHGSSKMAVGTGAALAKPGVALMMRTAEGEEHLTPFRSLDDLLSAVKPILRAAARSPDAVWFSIQPVDLALLDSDAA